MSKIIRRGLALSLSVVLLLLYSAPAHADTTVLRKHRTLSFENDSLVVFARVEDASKTITVTAELWRGTTRTGTWYDSGTSFAEITGVKTAHSGDTYTLKVSYTVNGTPYQFPDLVCVAP